MVESLLNKLHLYGRVRECRCKTRVFPTGILKYMSASGIHIDEKALFSQKTLYAVVALLMSYLVEKCRLKIALAIPNVILFPSFQFLEISVYNNVLGYTMIGDNICSDIHL